MATLELILLLLAAVLASAVIEQLVPKIPAPLIQILLGIFVELLSIETVSINFSAEFFLVLFIAPLLYDEARNADKAALLKNIRPVLGLAIGLVLVTMLVIGGVVHWMVPAIPFAAACMLGAALGPTDAVAVGSLPKDIDLGERRKQILQGEYLLNDASGIVGFQFALLVITTGTFSVLGASLEFLKVFFGGLIVGAVVGYVANVLERYFRNIGVENTTFHVLYDLFLPFIIYLTAETFGVSGIIAVVVGGLIRSLNKKGVEPVSSRLNIVSSSVWQTISFALNGTVFVLLGTQLPRAMSYTFANPTIGNEHLLLWTVVITVILLAMRFLWLLVAEYHHLKKEAKAAGEALTGKQLLKDAAYSSLLMTIAGPKGAVTLAVIFTIPVLVSDSAFFPERSLIIFLASGVILLTLLLSSVVLPLFAPKKNLSEEEAQQEEQDREAAIEVLRNVVRELTARQDPTNALATEQVVEQYNTRIARLREDNRLSSDEHLDLQLDALGWERGFVQSELTSGNVETLIGYRYINQVDRRENALLHRSEKINPANIYNEIKERVRDGYRNIRQRVLPNAAAEAEKLRDLQAHAYRAIIARLKREVSAGNYPPESVSAVLAEYRHALARIKISQSGFEPGRLGEIARMAEVEQTAIQLELEGITHAYDTGRLSRAAAKHMRENVMLMQTTLGEE